MYVTTFIALTLTITGTLGDDLPCAARTVDQGQGQVCVCNSSYCDTIERPPRLPKGQYHLYSTSNSTPGFSHTIGFFAEHAVNSFDDDAVFIINNTIQYQEIIGFGGSFSDSVGMVVSSLPPEAQHNFIQSYFGPKGLEYTFCRTPIGGSDFSPRQYTLDDVQGDKTLQYFSLAEEDYKHKIPYIRQAMSISPQGISLVACSWTSPHWMKTKNHRSPGDLAGYLNSEYMKTWAEYHVKFIQSYKKAGIDIWAITDGNEPILPLFFQISINNTVGFAAQRRKWIKSYLVPQLKAANFSDIKIFTMEDCRIYTLYWMERFADDPEAFDLIDGIALHWYADVYTKPAVLDEVHKKYPNKTIIYTESSINIGFCPSSQAVKLGSWNRGAHYIYNIIENLNHWAAGYIDWNLALDPNGGPTINLPIDAAIIVNQTSGEFYKQPIFYAMGHFSKFIPPRSRRVDVRSNIIPPRYKWIYPLPAPEAVMCVATANSDNSYTAIVLNNKNVSQRVVLDILQVGSIVMDLPEHSINSVVYWP